MVRRRLLTYLYPDEKSDGISAFAKGGKEYIQILKTIKHNDKINQNT